MRRYNQVKKLPPDLLKELNRRILEEDYRTIGELLTWCEAQGYSLGQAPFYRYVKRLKNDVSIKTVLVRKREDPEAMGEARILQEIGEISLHGRAIKARKQRLFEELERRQSGTAVGVQGGAP